MFLNLNPGKVFGRLRSICVSPAGDIYIATSNRDWNPNSTPAKNDDRIIRIYRLDAKHAHPGAQSAVIVHKSTEVINKGALLYANYCASCHKEDGKGIQNIFPALLKSPVVTGDKKVLMHTVINGRNTMPKFSFIEDNDLAVLLSYVRKQFGQGADAVSAEDIKKAKK